ncbi:MAG: hypothetical protein J0M33_21385 [Anaerolineae bacterium]|nr:hypothetical protein [Anaerolineae bacterium]
MTEKYKRKPDQLLMDTIGFDEDDLEANHAGKMGPNQVTTLKQAQRRVQVNVFLIALMIVVVSVLGLVPVLVGIFTSSLALLCGSSIFIVWTAFFPTALHRFRLADAYRMDSLSGDIERIEGRISLDVQARNNKSGPGSVAFTVRLEGRKLIVTREVFLAFKNGDPYALYYGPRSGVVLAAEWLREPSPGMDIPAADEDKEWVDMQEKPKHGGLSR